MSEQDQGDKPEETMGEFLDRMEREGFGNRIQPQDGMAVGIVGIRPPEPKEPQEKKDTP